MFWNGCIENMSRPLLLTIVNYKLNIQSAISRLRMETLDLEHFCLEFNEVPLKTQHILTNNFPNNFNEFKFH